MDGDKTRQLARSLFEQNRDKAPFRPIPAALRPSSIAEAYTAQEALQELFEAGGAGPIAGYKIAVIAPVIQRMMGIDHPCGGAIFARRIHRSPAHLKTADFVHLAIECEIAVTLGADLPPAAAPYTRETVRDAVASCAASIELVEDRAADYKLVSAIDIIAENAWNGGIVVGSAVPAWRDLDLARVRGQMFINDKIVGEGVGGDVGGHPFESVAWIANHLIARGRMLQRGMVLMTGSIVATQFPKPGDRVRVAIEGLGDAGFSLA
jgi:2-keto-4-pentenoate hydratase